MSLETPKLRDDLVIVERQEPSGKVSVIKIPDSERFFQAGEAERAVMNLMDGERSLEEIA